MKIGRRNILPELWNNHQLLSRFGIFFLTVIIISVLLPVESQMSLEYEKDKPWMHEDLIAPFDFPVYKTEADLKNDKAMVQSEKNIYIRKFDSVKIEALSLVKNRVELRTWQKELTERLNIIYEKGVADKARLGNLNEGRSSYFLVKDHEASKVNLDDFFTLQEAYDFLSVSVRNATESQKELLASAIHYNIHYDQALTTEVLQQNLNEISAYKGKVSSGLRIVSKGDVVDKTKFELLESFTKELEYHQLSMGSKAYRYAGIFILVSMAMLVLYLFLYLFRKDVLNDNLKVGFICIQIIITVVSAKVVSLADGINLYMVPFCLLPMIIRTFFDTRLALFTHVVTVLSVSFLAPSGLEFVFLELVAGIVAIFSIAKLQNRRQFFFTSFTIFSAYAITYSGFYLLRQGSVAELSWQPFFWFVLSVTFTLFAYPLVYLYERVFGLLSDVSLLELSDINNELLRELALKAPGTFQHSLQVANLAEAAINEIGGNPLLVRAGALYHDVGKIESPQYFIENQVSGVNPHNELTFEQSTEIIIGHVKKGVQLAKKHGLPDEITDFIRTHHGDSLVQYFYHHYLKDFPDGELNKEHFSYPGPRPFSKETAVLMMADGIEAASRSLRSYSSESIEQLVERILENLMEQEQFSNADITFKNINIIKKIFKKKLLNIYHVRMEYPE